MSRFKAPLQTFNRGKISKLGLARTDLERTKTSGEQQRNWMPRSKRNRLQPNSGSRTGAWTTEMVTMWSTSVTSKSLR